MCKMLMCLSKISPFNLRLLTIEQLCPTTDEISTLSSYEGDPSLLGEVEQFFLMLIAIPRFKQRLEVPFP